MMARIVDTMRYSKRDRFNWMHQCELSTGMIGNNEFRLEYYWYLCKFRINAPMLQLLLKWSYKCQWFHTVVLCKCIIECISLKGNAYQRLDFLFKWRVTSLKLFFNCVGITIIVDWNTLNNWHLSSVVIGVSLWSKRFSTMKRCLALLSTAAGKVTIA
jgi:hypothetical protein